MIRRTSNHALGQGFAVEEDANPLEFVANLSDVMLVLAVALMCALIAHWGLDFKDAVAIDSDKLELVNVEMTEDDMQQTSESGDRKYQKKGTVYEDIVTGDMYVVQE